MPFYVYVIRSVNHNRNYTGFTSNLKKRIKEHNSGTTKSTIPYFPWKLVFFEIFESKIEALKREKFLKSGQGRDLIKQKLSEINSQDN